MTNWSCRNKLECRIDKLESLLARASAHLRWSQLKCAKELNQEIEKALGLEPIGPEELSDLSKYYREEFLR